MERVNVKGNGQTENDAEHSYQLAMMAWYLIDAYDLDLDKLKVFQYALCHDLAETYTGDFYPFDAQFSLDAKQKAEKEALEKIKTAFPGATHIVECIEMYEKQEDAESQFVKGLDKILPLANAGLSPFDHSIENSHLRREDIWNKKIGAIQEHPLLHELFKELSDLFQKNNLFYPECLEDERKIIIDE